MFHLVFRTLILSVACTTFNISAFATSLDKIPNPSFDTSLTTSKSTQTAVFAGGCFWGVEAVFEHVKGVTGVTSGYAGALQISGCPG